MEFIELLIKYREEFWIGIKTTLKLTLIIWFLGIFLGSILGILGARHKSIAIPSRVFSFILSGIPALVFLYWLHYPLQGMLEVNIDGFYSTAFALTVINLFIVADLVRNALIEFPKQYITSAIISGFSRREVITQIQFPLIIRQVLPAIVLTQVVMLHSTLFGSFISVEEVFRVAERINSLEYKPIEIFSSLAIFFLIISLPLISLSLYLRAKFRTNFSK